jgi:hypothetical protein
MDWHGHQSAWTEARTRCGTRKTAHRWQLARKWESSSQRMDELGRVFYQWKLSPSEILLPPLMAQVIETRRGAAKLKF